jgi:hypothetical protein
VSKLELQRASLDPQHTSAGIGASSAAIGVSKDLRLHHSPQRPYRIVLRSISTLSRSLGCEGRQQRRRQNPGCFHGLTPGCGPDLRATNRFDRGSFASFPC